MSKSLHELLELDEADLASFLEELLARAGQHAPISHLAREPNQFPGVFPAEVVTVSLESGQTVTVHLKHLGSEHAEHPAQPRPELEIRVYDTLFRNRTLPVVEYYGNRWNSETKRLELYIEHIDGWNLKHEHLDLWVAAARCIGELHAHFAEQPDLLREASLPELDADYISDWAERALETAGTYSADYGNRLGRVVRRYEGLIPVLSEQPRTLVHADLSPKNVLVDKSREPARICIIDWEHARLGSGFVDLVHLKYGFSGVREQKMIQSYCSALKDTPLLPENPAEVDRVIAAADIYHRLYMLARSRDRGYRIETVEARVADLEHLTPSSTRHRVIG